MILIIGSSKTHDTYIAKRIQEKMYGYIYTVSQDNQNKLPLVNHLIESKDGPIIRIGLSAFTDYLNQVTNNAGRYSFDMLRDLEFIYVVFNAFDEKYCIKCQWINTIFKRINKACDIDDAYNYKIECLDSFDPVDLISKYKEWESKNNAL